jgi:hypothetical protein
MLEEAVESIVRGDRLAWSLVATLWLATTIAVFAHRRDASPSLKRVVGLLLAALATSAGGFVVASAIAIPRIRWKTEADSELVAAEGDTWRRLRGPTVQVVTSRGPDIAVPTLDAEDRWVLYGLIEGRPLDEYPPAPSAPPRPGAPRLCDTSHEACRAWPSSWPEPTQAPRYSELHWERTGARIAVAYDVESRLYLTGGSLTPQAPAIGAGELERSTALELIGRLSNDPSRETASSLFIARRIAGGRIRAVRIVSTPAAGGSYAFYLQRADVALTPGPLAFRIVARPTLILSALALPLALIAYLLAPAWLAALLRRRDAVKRELPAPLILAPIAQTTAPPGIMALASVAEDTHLGDALLTRGEVVAIALDIHSGEPVVSRVWFELPGATPWDDGPQGAEASGVPRGPSGETSSRRKVGVLIPADRGPFRRAADAWLSRALHSVAVGVAGLAALAPGLVALASLLAAR